jgi:hypothetical protein
MTIGHNNAYYSKLAADIRKVLSEKKFPSNEEMYKKLIFLEETWRDVLLSTKDGELVYEKFIDYILNVRKNILDCRPFFRIRQKEFINNVNPYIRKKKAKPLFSLRINSAFITWAMVEYKGPHKAALEKLAVDITAVRSDFITKNFPLILNRIKIIYHTSNLEMQDLISLASNAALVALDKFAPNIDKVTGEPIYTSVILSSIIARINAIVNQNADGQQLHLYPSDKKLFIEICRLRKDGLSNEDIGKKLKISEFEVGRFLNGIYVDALDDDANQYQEENVSRIPDLAVSTAEEQEVLKKLTDDLSIIEKKILILKNLLTYEESNESNNE